MWVTSDRVLRGAGGVCGGGGRTQEIGCNSRPTPTQVTPDKRLTWLDSGISLKVVRGVHVTVTRCEGSANRAEGGGVASRQLGGAEPGRSDPERELLAL